MSYFVPTQSTTVDSAFGHSRPSSPTRSVETTGRTPADHIHVPKVYAYVTRDDRELLVFEGPNHDGLQVPKGTVEYDESLPSALRREIGEESGLSTPGERTHLGTDLWQRRQSPLRYYVRHFFHVPVRESRDGWTHTVTGEGAERGQEFEFSWVELPTNREFALSIDDFVPQLRRRLDE